MRFTSPDLPGDAVLCYVRDGIAWFTTQPLDKQTGIAWDDTPHDGTSGTPYGPREGETWRLARLAFGDALLFTPTYPWRSVDKINAGAAPWLSCDYRDGSPEIMAGTSLAEFVRLILADGGTIYAPVEKVR